MSISAKLKPRSKKSLYRIVAQRMQIFEFEVTAISPEAACKSLQRKLKYDFCAQAPENATFQMSSWCEPDEEGHAWLIARDLPPADAPEITFMTWNGKTIGSIRFRQS